MKPTIDQILDHANLDVSGLSETQTQSFRALTASLVRSQILSKVVNRQEAIASTSNQIAGLFQARYATDTGITAPVEVDANAAYRRVAQLTSSINAAIAELVDDKILAHTPSPKTLQDISSSAGISMEAIPAERRAIYEALWTDLARQKLLSRAIEDDHTDQARRGLVNFLQERFTVEREDGEVLTEPLAGSKSAAELRVAADEKKLDVAIGPLLDRTLPRSSSNSVISA